MSFSTFTVEGITTGLPGPAPFPGGPPGGCAIATPLNTTRRVTTSRIARFIRMPPSITMLNLAETSEIVEMSSLG